MTKSRISIICLLIVLSIIIILVAVYFGLNYITGDNETENEIENKNGKNKLY